MPVYERTWGHSTKAFLVVVVLVLGGVSTSEETGSTPPIRIDAMFELMSNQMVDVVCDAPEFRACFDVPYAECSRELRKMLTDCRAKLKGELPDLITSKEADPIIEKTYACVIPKWDSLVKDRRTETEECRRIERQVKEGDEN